MNRKGLQTDLRAAGPSGLPVAPELYVVFTGERPQFLTYNVEGAKRWMGDKEFTHFVRYMPAPALEQPPAAPTLSTCWVCGERVSAQRPGYWQQRTMRPVHIHCHEEAEAAEKAGKATRKRARKRR